MLRLKISFKNGVAYSLLFKYIPVALSSKYYALIYMLAGEREPTVNISFPQAMPSKSGRLLFQEVITIGWQFWKV